MSDASGNIGKLPPEEYGRHYELKLAALERLLGPMHDTVGHAVIPYALGGPVTMYYFPNAIEGTACVTMDLIRPDGTGPLPSRIGTYELIAFTRHNVADTSCRDAFSAAERRLCGIFTTVGRYSECAVLNPGETCEVPVPDGSYRCVVLDEFTSPKKRLIIGDSEHALVLCIEVFRREMDFAMDRGSATLLKRLKARRVYPYSDLDRAAIV